MIEDRVSKFELRGTVNLHLHGTVFCALEYYISCEVIVLRVV